MRFSKRTLAKFPEAVGVMRNSDGWQHCRKCQKGCYETSAPKCEHIIAYRARAYYLETAKES